MKCEYKDDNKKACRLCSDTSSSSVYTYLVMNKTTKKCKHNGTNIKRNQFVLELRNFSKQLNMPITSILNSLDKLKSLSYIEIEEINGNNIITVN